MCCLTLLSRRHASKSTACALTGAVVMPAIFLIMGVPLYIGSVYRAPRGMPKERKSPCCLSFGFQNHPSSQACSWMLPYSLPEMEGQNVTSQTAHATRWIILEVLGFFPGVVCSASEHKSRSDFRNHPNTRKDLAAELHLRGAAA